MQPKGYVMPVIEVIKASEAPQAPKQRSKIAEEILTALEGLKKDEALKLRPDEGKSIRGLKTSIGRIASNAGMSIEQWDTDGYVYVKKAQS
jgi:hypothetical protein